MFVFFAFVWEYKAATYHHTLFKGARDESYAADNFISNDILVR